MFFRDNGKEHGNYYLGFRVEVFQAPTDDLLRNVNVLFNIAYRDRILVRGRHRGRRKPYS